MKENFPFLKFAKYLFFSLIFLVVICSSFWFGYVRGRGHFHEHIASDMIQRNFIISYDEDDEIIELENTILFPHQWIFTQRFISETDNSSIINPQEYVLTNSENDFVLIIRPKNVNYNLDVLSVDTVFNQEIVNKCLGTYTLEYESELKRVSVYREYEGETRVRYVQEVTSEDNMTNKHEDFVVFKHNKEEISGEEIVWTSDISIEFNENLSGLEKEKLLGIIDKVVISLQIK